MANDSNLDAAQVRYFKRCQWIALRCRNPVMREYLSDGIPQLCNIFLNVFSLRFLGSMYWYHCKHLARAILSRAFYSRTTMAIYVVVIVAKITEFIFSIILWEHLSRSLSTFWCWTCPSGIRNHVLWLWALWYWYAWSNKLYMPNRVEFLCASSELYWCPVTLF